MHQTTKDMSLISVHAARTSTDTVLLIEVIMRQVVKVAVEYQYCHYYYYCHDLYLD